MPTNGKMWQDIYCILEVTPQACNVYWNLEVTLKGKQYLDKEAEVIKEKEVFLILPTTILLEKEGLQKPYV